MARTGEPKAKLKSALHVHFEKKNYYKDAVAQICL